jgi:phosphate transport system protein
VQHLKRDLERLKREILSMGALVEQATTGAMDAVKRRDPELARSIVEGDRKIDEKEIEVEEECLKVLALHQPVAQDLRFIVATLKVNNDLERIGDLAQNISKRAIVLIETPEAAFPPDLHRMMDRVRSMVSRSLDSLVRQDAGTARSVLKDDEEVDDLHGKMYREMQARMIEDPARVKDWVGMLSISRYLERIADLSTNIAEDVIFTVEGEVVRHGGWESGPRHEAGYDE